MAKYIIDIPDDNISDFLTLEDDEKLRLPIYNKNGTFNSFIPTNLRVIPYTKPDINVVKKDQEDGWELAKKIVLSAPFGGLSVDEMSDCFDNISFIKILENYSYQEAKDKYNKWKLKKEQFCVGDEVKPTNLSAGSFFNEPWVVTMIDTDGGLWGIGKKYHGHHSEKDDVVKTGRHFDGVSELIKKMEENT